MEINKYLGLILLFCVTSVAYARQDEGCIVKDGWEMVLLKAIAYATAGGGGGTSDNSRETDGDRYEWL
ncbi:MAG: hypothetical protein ACLU4J_25355 [Butyricimonas paravirosa]